MGELIYQIEFFSYWHTSSGLAGGPEAHLMVIKNVDDLPFIPGRTLKGMLRKAADQINKLNDQLVTKQFIEKVFGVGDDHRNGDSSQSNSGSCFFSNAEISQSLSDQIIKKKQQFLLFDTIASTAIDQNGIAKDNTLRQVEVTIPLSLYAKIVSFPEDPDNLRQIKACMQWVKKMGYHRSRGLGRCEFTIHQNDLA